MAMRRTEGTPCVWQTSYGKIRASPFHIPTKINYFDKDHQLVASIQWHFTSFVGAHDFLDCKVQTCAQTCA